MKKYILSMLAVVCVLVAPAQRYRTTYFIPGSATAYELNPALMPEQSTLSIPVLGGAQAAISSDIALDKLVYPVNGSLVTFMDESVNAQSFMKNVNDINNINGDVSVKVLGLGIRGKKSYISFDINAKALMQTSMPKDFFGLFKETDPMKVYDLKNTDASMTSYVEAAVGYSRQITENLSVGAKMKYLAGIADMNTTLNKADVSAGLFAWTATTSGTMRMAMAGAEIGQKFEDGKTYYDLGDISFDSPGISGSGFAFDFGAEYNLFDRVKISAAVLDLGSIKWKAENTFMGVADQTFVYDGIEYSSGHSTGEIELDFDDIYKFQPTAEESYSTKLATTILLGAETPVLGEKIKAGVLYTYQVRELQNISRLMLSVNFNPVKFFSAAVSYTLSDNTYDSIGAALYFRTSAMNIYMGTDYLVTKFAPQMIPVSANSMVAYFGVNIAVGKRHAN